MLPFFLSANFYSDRNKLHVSFLLQGLRERNWTSDYYREDAEPWKIEIFEDSGRLMQPSWPGFRATVTDSKGQTSWVNMPVAGAETFTYVSDILSHGTLQTCYKLRLLFTNSARNNFLVLFDCAGPHGWRHQGRHLAAAEDTHRKRVHAPMGLQSGLPTILNPQLYNSFVIEILIVTL